MRHILHPWQLLVSILAGLINRDQQQAIDYLITENQVKTKFLESCILANALDSTTTSDAGWLSKEKCLAASDWLQFKRCSTQIRFCAGTGNWLPKSGITPIAASELAVRQRIRKL